MPPLAAGSRVLVRYEGFAPYHERIILGHMRGSLYFIVTPDADVYIEDYSMTNEDIDSVRVMVNEQVPGDLLGEQVHRFNAPMAADRLRDLLAEARLQAEFRGAALAPAAPARGRRGGAATVGPDGEAGKWRVGESGVPNRLVGEMVPGDLVPARAVERLPCKEIIDWDDEPVLIEFVPDDEYENWKSRKAPLDSRILRVKTTGSKRHRDWSDVLKDSAEVRMADWPLKGPRTAQWCVEFLAKQAGGAIDHHNLWRRTAWLGAQDFGVQEHEQILEVIKWGASFDQLDVCNSAAFEILFRRAQTIEFAHAERVRDHVPHQGSGGGAKSSGSLTYEEQEAFAGTTRSSCVMVAPELLDFVKSDVAKSSELMKSIVKAREFREQLGKHKK